MKYTVRLKGHLSMYVPGEEREVVLDSAAALSPAEIVERLSIPAPEVAFVASKDGDLLMTRPLTQDMEIEIYPSIAGG